MDFTEGQREILAHVVRYRLTTVDTLHRLFFTGLTRDAARKAGDRLSDAGWLRPFAVRNRTFYQLTRQAATQFGVPKNAADPLDAQALTERYGFLAFCCLQPIQRKGLLPAELKLSFPSLAEAPGVSTAHHRFYVDIHEGTLRLGRATLDTGGEYTRLLRKCRGIVLQARRIPPLRQLIDQDLFVLAILTSEPSKRAVLLDAIAQNPLSIRVRVEHIPELQHVL